MPTPEPFPYRKLNYPIVNLEQSFTLAEKLQGLANLGVPSSVNKAGQVLTVGDATGELEWSTVSGGGDIPSSSSADEGKVLTVDSNGEPQWAPPSGGGGGGDVTDVKVNGTSVVTNHVAEVTVPTKTSDLTNDSGFITSADLPTVNDGTLTIQKNGATVDTFTANSSTNKTVNISVPTKTSDLTNDSGFITSSDIPAVPVSDVQVDGVSVVSSGVANITLPTVNDGTLTIQKNGSTIDTFTANSSSNKTVDITVPTKTSDLTNDSGFITSASLPTVNDATLTIQKNGSTVDTFTANASSNKTVNITVPTKTSDLNNDSGFITSGGIPAQVNADWNATSGVAKILNKPTTTPIIPGTNITITETASGIEIAATGSASQVNADWNATSGVAKILNKPDLSVYAQSSSLATVATTGDYNDLRNKPSIPTVPTTDQTYNAASTNPQSGTAVAGALTNIKQVPASTQSDEGKALIVDSNGDPGWGNIPTVEAGDGLTKSGDTLSVNLGETLMLGTTTLAENDGSVDYFSYSGANIFGERLMQLIDQPFIPDAEYKPLPDYASIYILNNVPGSETARGRYTGKTLQVSRVEDEFLLDNFPGNLPFEFKANNVVMELGALSDFYSGRPTPTIYILIGYENNGSIEYFADIVGKIKSDTKLNVANALPDSAQADSGKVLTVNSSGTPEWATPPTVTLSTLNTAGITDIQEVASLPANPLATVLYLIPET